jgi:hypothetical protein
LFRLLKISYQFQGKNWVKHNFRLTCHTYLLSYLIEKKNIQTNRFANNLSATNIFLFNLSHLLSAVIKRLISTLTLAKQRRSSVTPSSRFMYNNTHTYSIRLCRFRNRHRCCSAWLHFLALNQLLSSVRHLSVAQVARLRHYTALNHDTFFTHRIFRAEITVDGINKGNCFTIMHGFHYRQFPQWAMSQRHISCTVQISVQ